MAFLVRKTFVDSDDCEIIKEGYKTGHSHYYMYVFKMKKVIGVCPWGYPTDEICVYFSWKESYGDKFHVITAYPFSQAYHVFLKQRKQGMATFLKSYILYVVKNQTALLGATTLIKVNGPMCFPQFF